MVAPGVVPDEAELPTRVTTFGRFVPWLIEFEGTSIYFEKSFFSVYYKILIIFQVKDINKVQLDNVC